MFFGLVEDESRERFQVLVMPICDLAKKKGDVKRSCVEVYVDVRVQLCVAVDVLVVDVLC